MARKTMLLLISCSCYFLFKSKDRRIPIYNTSGVAYTTVIKNHPLQTDGYDVPRNEKIISLWALLHSLNLPRQNIGHH